MENKIYCVVSHTHWDREWYMTLDQFRIRLVNLIDNLIEIIRTQPHFVFHLDAQTIVLEDYLEVRPEKRELLKTLIRSRQIIVGPWYLQNDFYLTSGEATIRNLIEGRRVAMEFNAIGTVGYAPDQFGNISQLPQILHNFGIDNFVFARGYSEYKKSDDQTLNRVQKQTEFIWSGADGSEVLAVYMKDWYNNAQRISSDPMKAMALLGLIDQSFENVATTPYLLLMNGVDHLEAQDDLFEAIEKIKPEISESSNLLQYNLSDYIKDVQQYVKENNIVLTKHYGELRQGNDMELLKGTLSSRHYLKVLNVEAQCFLENRLEPLYAILEANGMENIYPKDQIRYLWRMLIKNHPHDSICGCSRDEVHKHMEDLYQRFFEFGETLMTNGLKQAAEHTSIAVEHPNDYVISIINTLQEENSGIIEIEIKFLASDEVTGFSILDEEGKEADYAVISKSTKKHDLFSPLNLPGSIDIDSYKIYLNETGVKSWSVKSYLVMKSNQLASFLQVERESLLCFETNLLRLVITKNGNVDLIQKRICREIKDCLYIEDTADYGDAYYYMPENEAAILSKEFTPVITILENNKYQKRVKIEWIMVLPVTCDYENRRRSTELCDNSVVVILSMKENQPWLQVDYQTDNHAENHRMRMVINTDVISENSTADIPFDIVTHSLKDHYIDTFSRVLPNTSFAVIENEHFGMAVLTAGAHEYEHFDGNKLAFTILRAASAISLGAGDIWQIPGNQCKRIMGGKLALFPYQGDLYDSKVMIQALKFRNPLLVHATSCDKKAFSGGRPAVQITELTELFYPRDPYAGVVLKNDYPAFKVEGDNLLVSAVKQSEYGKGLILRIMNSGKENTTATISSQSNIFTTNMAEDGRHYIGRNHVSISLTAKKIETILLMR